MACGVGGEEKANGFFLKNTHGRKNVSIKVARRGS
jgi:hypothetical protein